MIALNNLIGRVRPLMERLDQMSLRERGMIFAVGVALVYCIWQTAVMDPIMTRARASEQRLAAVKQRSQVADQVGAYAAQDPAIAAAARNKSLSQRLATLDAELAKAAQGYVAPERMPEMLREMLAGQHGLRMVRLRNLPVVSLSAPPAASTPPGAHAEAAVIDPDDRGPFLHPVEIVLEGDYLSIVNYLHALENLPYQIHWQRLELAAGDYPTNRVRIEIGALSLSRDWITV
jgi:MSHA biogenesis protein MshJ